jgi:hypothetical protein
LKKASGDNFDKVVKNQEAPSYIYVWMAPQEQAVKIYDGNEEGTGNYTVKKVAKTQFLLMSVPDGNGTAGKVVPTSINMLPAYGTLATYVSGANYPAKGEVVYNFAPLSYLAKHDNFGTEAEISSTENLDAAHTTRYTYSEVENKISSIPEDYMFATHEYWRSIIPQAYAFSAFRGNGAFDKYSMGVVSAALLPGLPGGVQRFFHSYSKAVTTSGGKVIGYMLGMSKKPDYITNDDLDRVYQGYAKQSVREAKSGMSNASVQIPWIKNNNYRYTIRWEDKDGTAVLTQRYLGPRFVLDMDDIANEDFWAEPNNYNYVYPNDVKRVIPLMGAYLFGTATFNNYSKGLRYWYRADEGKSTQYWTPSEVLPAGWYSQAITRDVDNNNPMQVVGFRVQGLSYGLSGFFYYGYKGTPQEQNRPSSTLVKVGDGEGAYVENLKMAIPVRLWRKTTPYAD